ncbi:MAG: hypothetical protein ACYDBP_14445, partial [Leptospirales bacterium]
RWKKFCLQGDLHSSYSTTEVACLKTRAFLPGLKAGASCALKQSEGGCQGEGFEKMSALELFAKIRMWGAHIEIWMPGHLKVVKSSGK